METRERSRVTHAPALAHLASTWDKGLIFPTTRPPALENLCLLAHPPWKNYVYFPRWQQITTTALGTASINFHINSRDNYLHIHQRKRTLTKKCMVSCFVTFIATIGFGAVCVDGFRSVCPVSHFNVSGIGWCLKHGNLYVIPSISVWSTKWKLLEFITTAWCFGFVSPLGRNQTEGTRGESHAKDCRLQNADKNMCSLSQAATCHAQSCHWLLIATSTIFRREWLINNKSPPVFPLKSTTDGSGGRYAVVKE